MQTFLPFDDFQYSFTVLDYRRLGKQRVEAMQIINAIYGTQKGWRNHPAVKMWENYITALKQYHNLCIEEWVSRGYRNNMKSYHISEPIIMPHWVGNAEFHAAHRSNLLRKDPTFYGKYEWAESDSLPYIWPSALPSV